MSVILKKYQSMPDAGAVLGRPLGAEKAIANTRNRYQVYERGAIYTRWVEPTRALQPWREVAYAVYGAIYQKWKAMGLEGGVLGYPLTDELPTRDGQKARYSQFQGGFVYHLPDGRTFEVHGGIAYKWSQMGRELSPLGYPVSDELSDTRVPNRYRYSQFERGAIYWYGEGSGMVGAIYGAIYQRWVTTGREKGPLGFPFDDERAADKEGRGRVSFFRSEQNLQQSPVHSGAIFWTPTTGAIEVMPPFLYPAMDPFSLSPQGRGYPIEAARPYGNQGALMQRFERATLYYAPWLADAPGSGLSETPPPPKPGSQPPPAATGEITLFASIQTSGSPFTGTTHYYRYTQQRQNQPITDIRAVGLPGFSSSTRFVNLANPGKVIDLKPAEHMGAARFRDFFGTDRVMNINIAVLPLHLLGTHNPAATPPQVPFTITFLR